MAQNAETIEESLAEESKSPTAVVLYPSAGGSAIGLQAAGFRLTAIVDTNPDAVNLISSKFPQAIFLPELKSEAFLISTSACSDVSQPDLLFVTVPSDLLANTAKTKQETINHASERAPTSPPHPAVKREGRRSKSSLSFQPPLDSRLRFFWEIFEIVDAIQPRHLVFDLPALTPSLESHVFDYLNSSLRQLKYEFSRKTVDTSMFMVPQTRVRILVFASSSSESLQLSFDDLPVFDRTVKSSAVLWPEKEFHGLLARFVVNEGTKQAANIAHGSLSTHVIDPDQPALPWSSRYASCPDTFVRLSNHTFRRLPPREMGALLSYRPQELESDFRLSDDQLYRMLGVSTPPNFAFFLGYAVRRGMDRAEFPLPVPKDRLSLMPRYFPSKHLNVIDAGLSSRDYSPPRRRPSVKPVSTATVDLTAEEDDDTAPRDAEEPHPAEKRKAKETSPQRRTRKRKRSSPERSASKPTTFHFPPAPEAYVQFINLSTQKMAFVPFDRRPRRQDQLASLEWTPITTQRFSPLRYIHSIHTVQSIEVVESEEEKEEENTTTTTPSPDSSSSHQRLGRRHRPSSEERDPTISISAEGGTTTSATIHSSPPASPSSHIRLRRHASTAPATNDASDEDAAMP